MSFGASHSCAEAIADWQASETWPEAVAAATARAREGLLAQQHADGHWVFELEADCTIPAEYILMMHFMDEVNTDLQTRIARYLRNNQGGDGGWPLYQGTEADLSCSVKAYYALKLAGDVPEAPHMQRARAAILAMGGAARANVFTRIMLAQFDQVPWRAIPFMPVEIVLLPSWFPFHLDKVSYWSRTVMVPLMVLYSLKAMAKNPTGRGVAELFKVPPHKERHYFPLRSTLNRLFLGLERFGRQLRHFVPGFITRRALRKAESWLLTRLNGEGGLGAIFPAMVNAYEALAALGYGPNHLSRRMARKAIDLLLQERGDTVYCQPCVSPVWDTGLTCMALAHSGEPGDPAVVRGLDWLARRQLTDEAGDWQRNRPDLPGGGWPFQYRNDHYPDLDDTGLIAWAMEIVAPDRYAANIRRAADWLVGMQCSNGGFAAFDVDNTYHYLNHIPFADHGALIDPPTADVTARCVALFSMLDGVRPEYRQARARALDYLRAEQEADGSWFGRWGTNFIYGTWSVLSSLSCAGIGREDPMVARAVAWLYACQRPDGGWGETNDSYADASLAGQHHVSTAYQTAWAILALIATGERSGPVLDSGARFLLEHQAYDGLWYDRDFTAPGFPRVFYLKYHGYDKFFPLWALGEYQRVLREDQG